MEISSIATSMGFPLVLVKRRNFPENLIGPEEGFALEELAGEEGESCAEGGREAAIPPDEELPEASAGLPGGAMGEARPPCDKVLRASPGVPAASEFDLPPKLPALGADWPDSFCIGVSRIESAAERDFLPSEKNSAISIFRRD